MSWGWPLPPYMLPPPEWAQGGPVGPYSIIGRGRPIYARSGAIVPAGWVGPIAPPQPGERSGRLQGLGGSSVLVIPPYALTPGVARSTAQVRDGSRYILARQPVEIAILDYRSLIRPEPVIGARDLYLIRYYGGSLSSDLSYQFDDMVTGWVNANTVTLTPPKVLVPTLRGPQHAPPPLVRTILGPQHSRR